MCLRMEFSEWILAAGICVLPILVTGGIHLDGFCDTADALASHQDTEKKLQILKDPHMGAFAAIWLGCYFIAQLALAVTAAQMQADLTALAFGYCISLSLIHILRLYRLCGFNPGRLSGEGISGQRYDKRSRTLSYGAFGLSLIHI